MTIDLKAPKKFLSFPYTQGQFVNKEHTCTQYNRNNHTEQYVISFHSIPAHLFISPKLTHTNTSMFQRAV